MNKRSTKIKKTRFGHLDDSDSSGSDVRSSEFPFNRNLKKVNHWSHEESIKYCNFLDQNFQLFKDEQSRKKNKVFTLLAKIINTRTTHQIKSHHQKMIKKHKNIKTIIIRGIGSRNADSASESPLEDTETDFFDEKISKIATTEIQQSHQQNLLNEVPANLQNGIADFCNAETGFQLMDWFCDP